MHKIVQVTFLKLLEQQRILCFVSRCVNASARSRSEDRGKNRSVLESACPSSHVAMAMHDERLLSSWPSWQLLTAVCAR